MVRELSQWFLGHGKRYFFGTAQRCFSSYQRFVVNELLFDSTFRRQSNDEDNDEVSDSKLVKDVFPQISQSCIPGNFRELKEENERNF